MVFDRGHRTGELARAEFPGGLLVDREPWAIVRKCAATVAALATGTCVVFEKAAEVGSMI